METWLKRLAALVTGGIALWWAPGLEPFVDRFNTALHFSGPLVTIPWLVFVFTWAFAGALAGYLVAALMFHVAARRRRHTTSGSVRGF